MELKAPTPKQQIRELAREWCHEAFMEIVAIMQTKVQSVDARLLALKLEAAKFICEQGYGKAPMSINVTGEVTQYVMYMPAPVKDTTEWLSQVKPKHLSQ